MRRYRATNRHNRGQVALEYALAFVVVAGAASLVWIFSQGFVLGNLYGGRETAQVYGDPNEYGWAQENQALGLEKTAALPFP